MRTFKHWTPAYVTDRIRDALYRFRNPGHPWITRDAIMILSQCLEQGDAGAEFGSGGSTIWFAERIGRLVSVEHDRAWYERVSRRLADRSITNVDYRFAAEDAPGRSGGLPAYVEAAAGITPESLDFALIDGIYRDQCAYHILDKIRPGGLLVVDNVNWYLPSDSRSPGSRSVADGPESATWLQVAAEVEGWRRIWTTNGVNDTAVYIKPCRS